MSDASTHEDAKAMDIPILDSGILPIRAPCGGMALAGSLAAKTRAAPSLGAFLTHGPLFVGLLVGVIVIVGLLTYFPALALGPIVEHFQMLAGKTY
jgi:hypothetical protein